MTAIILAFILLGGAAVLSLQARIDVRTAAATPVTVVLDAGHGGEDGGAAAADGTIEKDVNLQIASRIALFFEWFGIAYRNIRQGDCLIGDNSLPTVRERKVSDIHRRMDLINSTPNGILLSIHQNFYVAPRYSGTQVFYAPNAPDSAALAQAIQNSVTAALQPENTRKIKPTEGTVYLLDKAKKTSVMVECGFLSNPSEAEKLTDALYQTQMAYYITNGLCEYINNQNNGRDHVIR